MPIGDLLASITGEPSPTLPPSTTFVPKRKATADLDRPTEKIQKTNSVAQTATLSRPISQLPRPSTITSTMANMKVASKASTNTATSSIKNINQTPPVVTQSPTTTKPPKKGSFAEIMARAKLAQESLGQVGKIQHKKIEKVPSKREREEQKHQKVERIQKNLGPNGKFRSANPLVNDKTSQREKGKERREPTPEKKVKKAAAATTGYTGTARPKPGGAKPISKSSSYSLAPDRYHAERRSSAHRYTYVSDDEEDDGYGDNSDASSDMEAAAFEVDEEEEEATRIARREDAEALAEENRLKREKLERKRRLAALAKSKR